MARNWTWRWVDWISKNPNSLGHWNLGYEVQSQPQCVKKAPHHLQIRWFVLIDLLWDFGLVHLELLLFKRPTYKWRFPKIGAPPNHPIYRWIFHSKPTIFGYGTLFFFSEDWPCLKHIVPQESLYFDHAHPNTEAQHFRSGLRMASHGYPCWDVQHV